VRPYGATILRGYHFALDEIFIEFLLTKRIDFLLLLLLLLLLL